MKKKNILFLFADDMRYDTIAALGNPEIKHQTWISW
jgi:arylsulfatase A-like enzyme